MLCSLTYFHKPKCINVIVYLLLLKCTPNQKSLGTAILNYHILVEKKMKEDIKFCLKKIQEQVRRK